MQQRHRVGALFAVFVRAVGAARLVRAVAPVAALVAVASIPLPRAASPIDVSPSSSGLLRMFDVAQRAANASGDSIAAIERRRQSSRIESRTHGMESRTHDGVAGRTPGASRIGDRWMQVRAGRAERRSGETSMHHVGDAWLHVASTPSIEGGSLTASFDAFSRIADALESMKATDAAPRAPPRTWLSKDAGEASLAPMSGIAQAASVVQRNDPAAESGLAAASMSVSSARVEEKSAERVGLSPLKLSPEQRNISRFVARRYRVNLDDVQRFVAHAFRAAGEFRIDPYLVLAVMSIESSFDPNARSSAGAQGLMQVLTRVHLDKFAPFGGARAALDPVANISVGSRILKEYLVREGSVEGALKSYVGAALLPHDFGYGNKVLGERERLAAAARGNPVPARAKDVGPTKIAMAERQARVAKAKTVGNEVAADSRQEHGAAQLVPETRAQEEL